MHPLPQPPKMTNSTIASPVTNGTNTTNMIYLPWSWTITSADPSVATCPTTSHILSTFAIVNVVVSAAGIILGNRAIVNTVTFGKMGKPGSHAWFFTWMVPVALQLLANAIIAAIIKHSAGYHANFKVGEMVLFLVARPRLTWIILCFFAGRAGKPVWVSANAKTGKEQYTRIEMENVQAMNESSTDLVNNVRWDYPWWNSFMAGFIGEIVLQCIAMYIMGRTAHFAATHEFYQVHQTKLYKSMPHGAHMMYAGALYYLIVGSIGMICAIVFLAFAFWAAKKEGDRPEISRKLGYIAAVLLLMSTWMGSWLFWAGFVELAGDL
jgi:hypothetical protein